MMIRTKIIPLWDRTAVRRATIGWGAMKSAAIGRLAVVIGAGMGGLAAARALADHFEQVLVLERDSLPAQPVYRKGTPQAAHVHALMAGGRDALVELSADFDRDLTRAGAVPIQVGLDIRWEA